jgi:hypothetical protein
MFCCIWGFKGSESHSSEYLHVLYIFLAILCKNVLWFRKASNVDPFNGYMCLQVDRVGKYSLLLTVARQPRWWIIPHVPGCMEDLGPWEAETAWSSGRMTWIFPLERAHTNWPLNISFLWYFWALWPMPLAVDYPSSVLCMTTVRISWELFVLVSYFSSSFPAAPYTPIMGNEESGNGDTHFCDYS